MEIKNLIRVKIRQELRDWLVKNSNTTRFCRGMVSMNEQTEVMEALWFGWIIDGIKRKY